METVREIFQSIYESYKDRIKSPLAGSFIITFLIANWKSVAIITGSEWPMHCRIEWVEEHFSMNKNFYYPLIIALGYILILPYLNIIFELCLKRYDFYKDGKKKSRRKSDLEQERDEAGILREIAEAKAGTSEIIMLNKQNENLLNEIKELNNRNQKENERLIEKELQTNNKYELLAEAYAQLEKQLDDERNALIPEDINDLLTLLTDDEIDKFISIFEPKTQNGNRLYPTENDYRRFIKLGLMFESSNNTKSVTTKAHNFYNYLRNKKENS